MFETAMALLEAYSAELGSVAVIGGGLLFAKNRIKRLFGFKEPPKEVEVANFPIFAPTPEPVAPVTPVEVSLKQASPDTATLTLSLDEYESRLAAKIAEATENLKTAHGAELDHLQTKIAELQRRAANPAAARAEEQETIAKLEKALQREGNEFGEARLAEAREAFEAGDLSIADEIFAEIEAREQLSVDRTARAAFARGEIAEQEIRWHDAAEHYAKAARLNGTFEHLNKAREYLWRTGNLEKANSCGIDLIDAAISEFGENTAEHAEALNEHALTLSAAGQYAEAEPLYKQAIKISKATIGETHFDYASYLNNFAGLYESMGQYAEAEPLLKKAIEIGKATIGEKHPDYAIGLNNLASLYESMGRYAEAEPLYKHATEITKAAVGENHPGYATRLNNLASLYYEMNRHDEAELLLVQAIEICESGLGPDHPNTKNFISNLAILRAKRPA